MPSNLLEVFTNCYGRYGVRAAIDLAPQAGITHLELAMKQHGGVLEIPEDVVASEKLGDEGIQNSKEGTRRERSDRNQRQRLRQSHGS